MKYFYTSDLHISHKNIIKYSNRPFSSVEHMNQHIADSFSVVKDGDTVWHLGDFAFCRIDGIYEFLNKINSSRFNLRMVTGNHDQELLKHRKELLDSNLIKEIVSYKEITAYNQKIILFHYSARVWNRSHHGSWMLWGHSHNSLPPLGKSVDVGFDSQWVTGKKEYRLFSHDDIESFMKTRSISIEDAHGERPRDRKHKD